MAEKKTTTAKDAKAGAAKTPAKPAAKATAKTETKPAAKPAAKANAKPAAKPVAKADTKPAAKPAAKADAKPAAKATAKTETKPAAKADIKAEAKQNVAAMTQEPKSEKQKAQKPVKAEKKRSGGGEAVAMSRTENIKLAAISIAAVVCVMCIIIGIIVGVGSCGRGSLKEFHNDYKNKTVVGYSSEIVGTVKRNKPVSEMQDEHAIFGNAQYPVYGYTLRDVIGADDDKTALRQKLIDEASYLCAFGTAGANRGIPTGLSGQDYEDYIRPLYTWMDKDGWLYRNNDGTRDNFTGKGDAVHAVDVNGNNRRLYQHTASAGLYMGNVSDDEKAVVKTLTFRQRSYTSYYEVTGLYAPAGEVLKVTLSAADMEATGGIVIHIGQALYNGQSNNIWASKNQMNRIPHVLNTLTLNKYTTTYDEDRDEYVGYIGSFVGGPVYVRDESATYSVTISGGVNYWHYILGVTTEKEFNEYKKSSAPYFDLEVWDRGVLHSGPRTYANKFDYDDIYKAAVLWEKVSLTSSQVKNQGIVFIYDPFVAAGAAVAFPGRRSVNCPQGWMTSSLDYNSLVTSGSWGNFHEYNHNFQGFGCGGGADGEVTNNSLNIVEYSLYTKISASRQLGGYGGAGLSGWNRYTSASWALSQVNAGSIGSTNGLAVYATLMHNLGQDAFIKSAKGSNTQYFLNWGENTHQNMSYYANLVKAYAGGTDATALNTAQSAYPMFVPVSCVYQTGRSYKYDGENKYIETQQPYVIPHGNEYTVDLSPYTVNAAGQYVSGSVVIPNGFTYTIKSVRADGINGKFEKTEGDVYKFTPGSELRSGKIYVTIGITKDDNAFAVDDVDLVLEFQQSHETNKNILQRTTYTYAEGTAYTSATEAYEKDYAGYIEKADGDSKNDTQNCNTDVWYTNAGRAPENSVVEVRGKLFIAEEGKYRIAFRGRWNVALYLSLDGGKTYFLGAKIETDKTTAAFPLTEGTYYDCELEANSWVYFKEVMICKRQNVDSFIGIGIQQWVVPRYTIEEVTDADGNVTTIYKDGSGKVVDKKVAESDTEPKAPQSVSYATGYRATYEFQKEFESEYFYTRGYNYDYTDNVWQNKEQTLVSSVYTAPPVGWGWGNFPIENLTDGNKNTYIHTSAGVSESKPLQLVLDMGEAKTVNRMIIYSQYRPNGDWKVAKSFSLQGSLDGDNFFAVGDFENVPRSGSNVTVNFDKATFRYYKLVVTQSYNSHIIIGEIEMWDTFEITGDGSNHLSPDEGRFTYKGDWQIEQTGSSFGHVYLGKKGATVSFEFKGTRLGIISSNSYGKKFEVTIDGKKVSSMSLKEPSGLYSMSYLSGELKKGTHTVTVKCKGTASIDSFAIF